jgi:hypothetical protein
MTNKKYITIRYRELDQWFGGECPDCGASISHKTVKKAKNAMREHGAKYHNWDQVKFMYRDSV